MARISESPSIKHKAIFQHLTLKEKGHPMVQAIMSGHAVAVSSGSFKDAQGTTGWMFYDNQDPQTSLGEGVIKTPGTTRAQGSYRSKLSRIFGIITTVNVVLSYYQQTQGAILIVCDGKAMLTKSRKSWASNLQDKHSI